MIKNIIYIIFSILLSLLQLDMNAQNSNTATNTQTTIGARPKLVVGIVIDQMRYDYITRFYGQFDGGGFKKMIADGFLCKNHHYNYIPTKTASGHASIATGTTPSNHGILGNNWYDKEKKEKIYCVEDLGVSPVGTSSYEGKKSPSQLQLTTLADQNRLHTQRRGKTISISLKDRAAILSGGHMANAAYWFRGKDQGSWISSSYYMDRLPQWVLDFNESNAIDNYFKKWEPLHDIQSYGESGKDNTNFERGFKGKEDPKFPYDLEILKSSNKNYDIIKSTPFGNDLTIDFAIKAIDGEQLGKDTETDFLLISFSSTDYIGHNFGVNSKEIEDTYLRLDKGLERLLLSLDARIGKGAYTVYLTSDHGATNVPQFLKSVKIPAGYFKEASFKIDLKNYVYLLYNLQDLILDISNNQVFLNEELMKQKGLNPNKIQYQIAQYILKHKDIKNVYTRTQLENTSYSSGIASFVQQGFHQKRSGDILYTLNPFTVAYAKTGSAHGSGYTYDTHVPLLFYGFGINKGHTSEKTLAIDIAPTIASLLGIAFPNGATGTVISSAID
ncbi:alkaline phosphatase PafA [Aquimarina latercula]|uniref:alkaline phosphatase PafA n=1 Tax=Aquimarina latercula TaxID=987 RepID=UPI0009D79490|nr:alkaline phosphatase PafA [Aquimarina latercula]